MSFLDPKEQVIEIQLTQHGKRLLSQGLLEPVYYAFYDDDILYDSLYYDSGSIYRSEEQNVISDRIKESPQLGAHYNFNGVETSFLKYKKIKMLDDRIDMKSFSEVKDEENYNVYSLGDSSNGTENLSAYDILFLNGEINGSVTYLSSSVFPSVRVPQLESDILFKAYVGSTYEEPNFEIQDSIDKQLYDDGSYIVIDEDYLLVEIDEKNTDFLDENFDIEIFRIEKSFNDVDKQSLIPLHFMTVEEKRKDIFEETKELKKNYLELDEKDVEYYFDILVDNEIDDEIICKAKKDRKTKNIFVKEDRQCQDKKQSDKDIYRSSDDQVEDC